MCRCGSSHYLIPVWQKHPQACSSTNRTLLRLLRLAFYGRELSGNELQLRRIWLDHLVILLPGQDISTDQRLSSQ